MASLQRQSTSKKKHAEAAMREHSRNKRLASSLVLFLAVVAAFVLGFAVRSNTAFMASLGITGSDIQPNPDDPAATEVFYDKITPRIDEVESTLISSSLDTLNIDQATQSMLTDMMQSTDDPYAAYFSSERYEAYIKESADRGYAGIGVLFGDYDGRAYATDVFSESEAAAKGVQQGDFVESINGDSSHKWTLSEVVGAISDSADSSIVITWMRPVSLDATTGTEFTTTLKCHVYEQQNVNSELRGSVGYIKVRQMTSNCSDLVSSAVAGLTREGATSFVLDVRDNPGGYLTQALNIASLFVNSGVLVNIETIDGTSSRTATGVIATEAPLVVLTNNYTAASAEVLVAALADNQRATTVGQTTMGKGSVQVVRELTFGGAIRYTAAYYLTPLGKQINKNGVVPEIAVAQTGADDDTQLLVALDTAGSLVR